MSNELTFTIGREELVIRQRWEVVSIARRVHLQRLSPTGTAVDTTNDY